MECIVEYDYVASQDDELTICKGDVIRNVVPFEDGWKKGWLNGREGVFPDNFVRIIKTGKDGQNGYLNNEVITKFKEQLLMNISKEEKNFDQIKYHVPNEICPSELQKNNSPSNFNKSNGIIDKNSHELKNKHYESLKVEDQCNKVNSLTKESLADGDHQTSVVVLFEYKAENPDEINLEVGEIIKVIDKDLIDEGWWKGIKKTGEIGIFPSNFVQQFSESNINSPIIKKLYQDDAHLFKQHDLGGYREKSNISCSDMENTSSIDLNERSNNEYASFNDLSLGFKNSNRNNSPGKTINKSLFTKAKTKNVNVNSMSGDGANDLYKNTSKENNIKSHYESHRKQAGMDPLKSDDTLNYVDRNKYKTDITNITNQDLYLTKTDFDKFKYDVEFKISKLNVRIQTLMEEIDEEKKQRAASEIELVRLRRVVHMLDAQTLNGIK